MARLSLTERFSDVDLQPSTFAHIPHFNLKKCLILISRKWIVLLLNKRVGIYVVWFYSKELIPFFFLLTLRKKCPCSELFWSAFSLNAGK